MLYLLLSDVHYLDFSLEKGEMYRQIAEDGPLPFARRGLRPWPEVETLLARALSKEPDDRFPSVAEFAARLSEVVPPDEPGALPTVRVPSKAGRAPAEELLEDVLRRLGPDGPLLAKGLGSAPLCSVNNGAAGIAYALYRIACARDDAQLLSLADLWATRAARDLASDQAFFSSELEITPEIVGPVSPYHTASGVSCVQALIAQAMGDVVSQQSGLDGFLAASAAPCENLDLTLGRSGTLLACSLLLDSVPENALVIVQPLRAFGHDLVRGLWEELNAQAPIRDVPRMAFLGIAHGWAGALYATLRWCHSTGEDPAGPVGERLRQLAELAEPDGRGVRWKRKLRKRKREQPYDYVPSWCNGTAGFVHLWTLAHRSFRDPAFLELAERAAWNAYDDPTFLGDLCCGLAGRAYALLNLSKATGEAGWLQRARDLADQAALSIATTTVREDSLYKGAVGVAVLAAELSRPEAACMPLFEHEGWPARP
jgi:serine/threonine-protein kinase